MVDSHKISVIVPIYNTEKYIERCIDSILKQTMDGFEIILIDDGSTDKSVELCDEYARNNFTVKAYHKINGGLSSARNYGLEKSSGEYVIFIDSDDFIEENMLELLYNGAITNNADIAVCGIMNWMNNGKYPQSEYFSPFVCKSIEAMRLTLEGKKIGGSICNKLIRRDIIKNHKFMIGVTYEDAFMMPELLLEAERIFVASDALYNYWHREDSITTKSFSLRAIDVIRAYDYTLEFCKKNWPDLVSVATFRADWARFVVIDRIIESRAEVEYSNEYKQVVSYLKKHWQRINKSPFFTKNRRISVVLLKINVGLYKLVFRLNQRKVGGFNN